MQIFHHLSPYLHFSLQFFYRFKFRAKFFLQWCVLLYIESKAKHLGEISVLRMQALMVLKDNSSSAGEWLPLWVCSKVSYRAVLLRLHMQINNHVFVKIHIPISQMWQSPGCWLSKMLPGDTTGLLRTLWKHFKNNWPHFWWFSYWRSVRAG